MNRKMFVRRTLGTGVAAVVLATAGVLFPGCAPEAELVMRVSPTIAPVGGTFTIGVDARENGSQVGGRTVTLRAEPSSGLSFASDTVVTLAEGWAETTATALEPGSVEIRATWDTGDGVATAGWTVNITPH